MNVDDDNNNDTLFIQQPSIFPSIDMMPATKKQDEQKFRDELIEKATMRLRRRLLEEQLSEVMQSVIQMQSQLEFLRVDASATIDAVANIQDDVQHVRLEALERRLDAHRKQLDQLTKKTTSSLPTEGRRGPADIDVDEDDHSSSSINVKGCSTKKSHAFSMSRLSSLSLMSSLFSRASSPSTRATSSVATSSCGYDDDDLDKDEYGVEDDCMSVASSMMMSDTPEERQRRHRRRRRVKHHRQAQMMRTDDVTELQWSQKAPTLFPLPERPATNTDAAALMHHDDIIINNNNRYNNKMYLVRGGEDACSDISSNSDNSDVLSDIGSMSTASTLSHPRALYDVLDPKQLDYNTSSLYPPFSPPLQQQCHDRARHPLSPLTENFLFEKSVYSIMSNNNNNKDYYELDRNVLDDALSFLDSMSVDDGGFGDDIEFLLRHPDLCCRPLDEIRTTMVEFRNKHCYDDQQENVVTIPTALYHYGASWMSSMGYSACVKSVRWCKFLSILLAATMISVLKGPDDMLDAY